MRLFRGHWQLIALTALVFVLWQTPVILPLKILVVFLHEVSHGTAAMLTGGKVESISLSTMQGGVTVTRGGSLFVILSAGYVGSLLIGVVILLIALRTHADRGLMALLGLVTLVITAFYMREIFPLAFGLGTGILMLAMARYLPRDVNDLVLRLIGLTSMIYVPYDIFSDTIVRSSLRSDAYMLAENYGGATVLWGGLWLVLSLGVIGLCLRFGLGAESNISFKR
ncbi:MAG: M50 family metallopeptidase [Rhodobacteraceae bacterium]|nr:M50 family metallopeptidase [Paracoccaceae bacterium]